MEWYYSRLLSFFDVRKINVTFPIKQKSLLLYVIMSFDNLYLFKLYT